MFTKAQDLMLPPDPSIFRAVFLYVGQGDGTLLMIPNGDGRHRFILVDIKLSPDLGGLDVITMLEDLLPRRDGRPVLDAFVNTHPHNDHIGGVDQLRSRIQVDEVWHTGFAPSAQHEASYRELSALMRDVQGQGGRIWEYRGTRDVVQVGTATLEVLSPADHTKDEIDRLRGEPRDARIHDYCGVLRVGYGSSPRYVLITGDADLCAWKDYILGSGLYHRERCPADVLSAPHHGSRSFFVGAEGDEPYTTHIELIDPTWVVISSPTQSKSPHGHPHEEALALYRRHVRGSISENVVVLGDRPECLLYDVTADGQQVFDSDRGELLEAYPLKGDSDRSPDDPSGSGTGPAIITSKLDRGRPMGTR